METPMISRHVLENLTETTLAAIVADLTDVPNCTYARQSARNMLLALVGAEEAETLVAKEQAL